MSTNKDKQIAQLSAQVTDFAPTMAPSARASVT
jgi:hypothetical protein